MAKTDTDVILPDLECEVEINEDPDTVPQPVNIKAEKINDIKTNSIESAEESLLVNMGKEDVRNSSSATSDEENKLAYDKVAELDSDVIGEQLEKENGDNDTNNESDRCNIESNSNDGIHSVNIESEGKEKRIIDDPDTHDCVNDAETRAMSTEDNTLERNVGKEMAMPQVS